MKRLCIPGLCFGLAIGLTDAAMAQQKLTKEQFVGIWTVVSCANARGGKPPYCTDPNGLVMTDSSGRTMVTIVQRGRAGVAAGNRTQRSPDDYKAAAMGLVADFGTWSFNDASQVFTFHREASLFANDEGVDANFSASLSGDELRMVAEDGGVFVLRRAR